MGSDELVAMNAGEFLIHMVEENQVPMEKWLPYLQEYVLFVCGCGCGCACACVCVCMCGCGCVGCRCVSVCVQARIN